MLSVGLLEQAKKLAAAGSKGRPRQADVRRGVSSAYYAMFHFLIDQACRALVGSTHDVMPMRRVLARTFAHNVMAAASKDFARPALADKYAKAVKSSTIPLALRKVAETFVTAQRLRHDADYDTLEPILRDQAIQLIAEIERAMQLWSTVSNDPQSHLYLLALLIGDKFRSK